MEETNNPDDKYLTFDFKQCEKELNKECKSDNFK